MLTFYHVVVYQSCHSDLILRSELKLWILYEQIMLSQYVIHIQFLLILVEEDTYFLCEVLDKHADLLHVFCLTRILHHHLHMLLHLWKIRLNC